MGHEIVYSAVLRARYVDRYYNKGGVEINVAKESIFEQSRRDEHRLFIHFSIHNHTNTRGGDSH